jgi:hypothetical protein
MGTILATQLLTSGNLRFIPPTACKPVTLPCEVSVRIQSQEFKLSRGRIEQVGKW